MYLEMLILCHGFLLDFVLFVSTDDGGTRSRHPLKDLSNEFVVARLEWRALQGHT